MSIPKFNLQPNSCNISKENPNIRKGLNLGCVNFSNQGDTVCLSTSKSKSPSFGGLHLLKKIKVPIEKKQVKTLIQKSGIEFDCSDVFNFINNENVDLKKFIKELPEMISALKDKKLEIPGYSILKLQEQKNFDVKKFINDLPAISSAIKESGFDFSNTSILNMYIRNNMDAQKFSSELLDVVDCVKKSGIEFEPQDILGLHFLSDYNTEKLSGELQRIGAVVKENNLDFCGEDILNFYHNFYSLNMEKFITEFKSISPLLGKAKQNGMEFDIENLINYFIYKLIPENDLALFQRAQIKKLFENLDKASHSNLNECVKFTDDEIKFINSNLDEINIGLQNIIKSTSVSNSSIKKMFKGFFANNNPEIDNVIKSTDFTKFGRKGIPLKYSRSNFVGDLNSTLDKVDEKTKNQIVSKLGIILTPDSNGYDGIIDLSKLSTQGTEGEVLKLATKFIKENSVKTGDKKLDECLNSLIEGMPELLNVIGKQQHRTHNLSVDTHIFTVYKEAISNPKYEKLSDVDKTCLKLSTMLHDISKEEGVVDKLHPETSSIYARDILEKYNLPVEIKDRVQELIKNHHWLEAYNTGAKDADYIATLFRRRDDLEIAKIMADSDLKGVSKEFYNGHKNALNQLAPIDKAYKMHNKQGQIFLTSRIVKRNLIPQVKHNGKTYEVINFSKLSNDFDLSEYGFEKGLTPKNLRLFVHMTNEDGAEILKLLSNPKYESLLCSSYISLDKKATYYGQKLGFVLQSDNVNIVNASKTNWGSGCGKGFKSFAEYVKKGTHRDEISNSIRKELGLGKEEYGIFYDKLVKKKYYGQIKDDEIISIGSKSLTGKEIKQAIQKANDGILNSKNNNEVNLYVPKINAVVAKVDDISEVPQEYLDFAHNNNYPIYLLGSN